MLYGPIGLNSFLWQFVFVILSVPRRAPRQVPRDITGHLSTSRQICYDKYSDKYRRHNLVTNVQLSLRLMTTGSVSHRRGIMTHLLWPQPYRHCCVIEGVQWQEKDYNCHNQLVIEGLTSCSVHRGSTTLVWVGGLEPPCPTIRSAPVYNVFCNIHVHTTVVWICVCVTPLVLRAR